MNYADFGIDLKSPRISGEVACVCPKCSQDRKKKNVKCLYVNLDKQVWNCQHCGWAGALKEQKMEKVVYQKPPAWKNNTELSDKLVKWFESRKISQSTLKKMRVTQSEEFMPQAGKKLNTINFNYFRNNELINIKYRDGNKGFKLFKDAELIFYNLDHKKEDTVFIVEGEIDALSFVEAGMDNVLSVPNGANLNNNNLKYVDNCIDYFDGFKTIILAVDNDPAGRKLREELAVRLGIERCQYVDWGDYKDANELLVAKGIEGLHALQIKDFPLEGVFTIEDHDDEINDLYVNGLDRGTPTGMPEFDEAIRFVKGYLTVITGIPSHGKSDFLDQLTMKLNVNAGWRGAFYSPENRPTKLHFSKMARKLVGKSWFGENRITLEELAEVKKYLNEKVYFIKPEKDFSLDSILKSVKQLKRSKGIDYFVIDAWNKLEHRDGGDKTGYIGKSLDKLAIFLEENDVHCFMVAHPRKMGKIKDSNVYQVPTLYDISDSAHFFNKADNGICVYRDFDQQNTQIHIQKVKFNHWGEGGMVVFNYDLSSGRYNTTNQDLSNWITKKENAGENKIEPNYNFFNPNGVEETEDDPF